MNAVVTESKSKLPSFINLLLIIALGISLAKLMWLVLTPAKKINTQTQLIGQTQDNTKQKINYGKLIASQHLFGQVKKVVKPKKEPKKAATKTVAPPVQLNLKLHGVIAYETKKGFALISSNGKKQKVFARGDEIEKGKGVTVEEIYPEKVVINNNGKTEELLLPVKKIKSKPSKAGTTTHSDAGASFGGGAPLSVRSVPNNQEGRKQRKGKVNLSNFRQEVMRNPKKLMDVVITSPAVVNGQFIGFRIQPGRNRRLFRDLGFRPNDIIMEVNGTVIDSMGKGAVVLGDLANASEISVRVKRGSQELYLQRSF